MSNIVENEPFWQGDLTFTYTIRDAAGNTSEGSVIIPAPDAAPTAMDDTATAVSGTTIVIDVLANDTDPEGGTLSLTAANAISGSAIVTAENSLAYTAPAGFTGTDTVTYTVSDPAGNTSQGEVSVTVEASMTLKINSTDTLGDFSIETNDDGNIILKVLEPAEYAGDYTIVMADLQSGPLNLVPPQVSGTIAAGQTLSVTSGLWAGDEVHGAIGFEYQCYAGSVPIAGATNDIYQIQSADLISGLDLTVSATNTAGTQSATLEVAAPGVAPSHATVSESSVTPMTVDGHDIYELDDGDTITFGAGGEIDILLLGGGASGGTGGPNAGGGGTGGQAVEMLGDGNRMTVSAQQYTATVGAGGAFKSGTYDYGASGGTTTFNGVSALGGTGGGRANQNYAGTVGYHGGAGGGRSTNAAPNGGYASGNGTTENGNGAGGGAGAGGAGQSAGSGYSGDGGVGYSSAITGSTVYYAGGGGGGNENTGLAGSGGQGGGGNGAEPGTSPQAGSAPGAGGGGGCDGFNASGAGAPGKVIIRVASP